jgi:hypothetical protein
MVAKSSPREENHGLKSGPSQPGRICTDGECHFRTRRSASPPSGDTDKFIDIESGAYEIDPDDYTATELLLARLPDAQIWPMRVGQSVAYRIGPQSFAMKQ